MKKIALLMICISIMGSSYVSGQKKYQALAEEDNVLVSYRWKSTKAFKKDSPYKLVIKIDNDNDYAAEISFDVEYYWNALKTSSSGEINYCLKANKAITGDLKGPDSTVQTSPMNS